MNQYVTGTTIRTLREKRGYTQKQLAEQLLVSDKAVSKWETGKGLPDISLLEPLAKALGVSIAELLRGECITNRNRAGNMQKAQFYVCPVCGNVIYAMGSGSFSCCGITLPPLEAEPADDDHAFRIEPVENEYFVSMDHPMCKEHSLSFLALVTVDRILLHKLYPEQNPEVRFPAVRRGTLYAYCSRHGLFVQAWNHYRK